MDWIVVATAPDQMIAEMWSELLRSQGIPARLHPGDTSGFLGISPHSVRVLVPEGDSEKARDYMNDILTDAEDPGV
jgi:hypothetical protein